MTPTDSDGPPSRPSGLPTAMAGTPTMRFLVEPSGSGLRSGTATDSTATSVMGSLPTTSAWYTRPSDSTTWTALAPSTTWWLVMMWVVSKATPDPEPV